jgi:hypothetical protein
VASGTENEGERGRWPCEGSSDIEVFRLGAAPTDPGFHHISVGGGDGSCVQWGVLSSSSGNSPCSDVDTEDVGVNKFSH